VRTARAWPNLNARRLADAIYSSVSTAGHPGSFDADCHSGPSGQTARIFHTGTRRSHVA